MEKDKIIDDLMKEVEILKEHKAIIDTLLQRYADKCKFYEEVINEFIEDIAWEDVKYDCFMSTMDTCLASRSAIPRYAKKYFDLLSQIKKDKEIKYGKF